MYIIMGVCLLVASNLVKDIIRLNRVDDRLRQAETELDEAKQEQAELREKLAGINNGFWLERQIRNVLNMAKPNEVVVIVPEAVKQGAAAARPAEDEPETAGNLQQWLLVFGFD